MSFVHLHVHSEYSLLDGFSNIKKLVKRAKEMGMPAVALTDHGTMFGVIDFYNAATAAGIKPVIGIEAYLAARGMKERDAKEDKKSSHLLLLAENETGYHNLLQLASTAQLEGFYYYPRIDKEFLAQHAEGLICTSGCMSAEIPRLIQAENFEEARRQLDWYYEVFGPERFYLELQQHDIPELDGINKNLITLGRRYDAKFVATNDVHYINKDDARLQDIMLAIQTGCVLSDPNRMRMSSQTFYLRSPEEMGRIFQEIPDALNNTLLIAERCNLDLGFKGYHLPEFDVPEGKTAQSYLKELCEAGIQRRYGARSNDPVVRQRLEYELGVIHQMGFDTYFLIVWDLCRYAREQGIWYNARGSAAGSIVAYALDITLVDPIEHQLIFERFLNPGRISMPDIDLDFRDDRRAEMLNYTSRKYGEDKVAQIITFGTLGARAAIRDVGRVMDVPLSEVDRVAKLIPNIPGKPVTVAEALEEIPDFKNLYQSESYLKELIDTASQVEGVVRNAGTHAAGVIITDKPTIEYIPLHRPTGNANNADDIPIKTVSQFEMSVVESLGLLKVDFLGLATLSIMARACDLIQQRHGVELSLQNIPVDDPGVYEMMGRGETAGVFQVEGSGMRRWLMQMKPKELANVIAMVALFRPGPMDFIPGYIKRMHGEEKVEYRHPMLEPIFKETYGYPVYQEQLMFAAMNLAGYTAPEADDLRKAIAKKLKEKLEKHREKFVKGSVKNGIAEETAKAIFADWEEFARYGFNKCLPGSVEVTDAETGRVAKIQDLVDGKATLKETVSFDMDSLKVQTGRVAKIFANGIKPVFRLTTALGRKISATGNHPFYTYQGWRDLETLKPGDYLAVPRRLPVEGKRVWPDHEVIALGHLLAEGNLCHPHSVYFYSQEQDQVDDFVQAANCFPNVDCSVATHKSTFSVYARRLDRHSLPGIVPWAQRLGIWGKNARQKEIPSQAFELNNRQIGLLISRMWEGDGHIDLKSNSLYYATACERLAQQLQHLLLRLGILSRVRTVIFPYKDGRVGYQVFITNRENISRFSDQIGCHFISAERRNILEALNQSGPVEAGKDIIPAEIKALIRCDKERAGITWTQMNQESGIAQREFYPTNSAGKLGFTRHTIERLAEYFDDPQLRKYAHNDIYWDRIVSIESVGEEPTYDLEVPNGHNFVANDILVHNSHAADYGVIAVQTAYLKLHYPEEYMTALLSVSKNEMDKVALYVADCRRMGITVAPPDVNASGYDFTIEDRPDGTAVIRFGMGAVKNVGQGPVDAILKARGDKPFTDLNDFARRADLRQVGKRALESLIKVGALDSFGTRPALLAAQDRILSVSSSHFRAVESGQMSLFGMHTGVVEDIILPKISGEINRREILNWERELIGLYVSDHPLSPVMEQLTNAVTHFSGQLSEASANERVRVAGLITLVRSHMTKTGKAMAFVTLEDLQGTVELVIFPKTWEKFGEMLEPEQIVMVDGRVDNAGAEPKVLVDNVSTEFKVTTPFENGLPAQPANLASRQPVQVFSKPQAQPASVLPSSKPKPVAPSPIASSPAAQKPGEEDVDLDWLDEDTPPPPEEFPLDWEIEGQKILAPAPTPSIISTAPGPETENVQMSGAAQVVTPISASFQIPSLPASRSQISESELPPFFVSSQLKKDSDAVHMITVIIRSTGDKTRDVLRMRRIHGLFSSYPGSDRFAFYVFERNHNYLLEFPNFTTGWCPDLIDRLNRMVGTENVKVEPITYQ